MRKLSGLRSRCRIDALCSVSRRASWAGQRVSFGVGEGEGRRRTGTHELVSEHEDGLEGEAAPAECEEVLEARAEEVDDEHVVGAL